MDPIDLNNQPKKGTYITNLCIDYKSVIDKPIYYKWFNELNLCRVKIPYYLYIAHIKILNIRYTRVLIFLSKEVKWVLIKKFDFNPNKIDKVIPVDALYSIKNELKNRIFEETQKYDTEMYPSFNTNISDNELFLKLTEDIHIIQCIDCKNTCSSFNTNTELSRCLKCTKSNKKFMNENKIFSEEDKYKLLEDKFDDKYNKLEDKYNKLEDKYNKLFLSNIKTCHFVNSLFREFTKFNTSEPKDILYKNILNVSDKTKRVKESGIYLISLGLAKVLFSNNVFHINNMKFEDIEKHFGEKQIYTYGITNDVDLYMEQIYSKFKIFLTMKNLFFDVNDIENSSDDSTSHIVNIEKILFSSINTEMLENSILILKEFFNKISPEHTKYKFSTDSFKEYYDFLKGQVVILSKNDITAVTTYYNML